MKRGWGGLASARLRGTMRARASGNGTWAVGIALSLATPGLFHPAAAQQAQSRLVIATNVACRTAPDVSSAVVVEYQSGDVFLPRAESDSDSGIWYLDTSRVPGAPSSGCWIQGSLTAEWSDRESALLAAADRILGRPNEVPFEDLVAVVNLLEQTPGGAHAGSTVLETSPLLQLRRLQVLERAVRAPGTWRTDVRQSPLKSAWFHANADVLSYFEPAGAWILPAARYWDLHERHRSAPFAEEIAWVAAMGSVPDDECDAHCVLSRLNQTYARYWATYPGGRWLSEALAEARPQLEYAASTGCFGGEEEALAEARAFRTTLREVTAPGRQQLLELVGDVERRCNGDRPPLEGS